MAEKIYVDASEVLRNLDAFKEVKLKEALANALTQAAFFVEGEAKRNVDSVQSGELRASIISAVDEDESGLTAFIGSNLEYAPYVEFGTGLYTDSEHVGRQEVPWRYQDVKGEWHTTSGMRYKHFLTDAVNKNRDKIITYFKGVLDGK